MIQFIDAAGLPSRRRNEHDEIAPWIHEEELVHALKQAPPSTSRRLAYTFLAMGAFAITASYSTVAAVHRSFAGGLDEKQPKHSYYV